MPHLAARRTLIAGALAALAAMACGSAGAALYKWVDEKGVTHYSQEPPPDGKATKMELRTDSPAAKPESPESWKDKELELRRRRLEKERSEQKEEADATRAEEQRHARCLQAQGKLNILQAERPVFHVNEKGERVYLEDAEREAEIKRWRDEAEKWCR